MYGIHSIVRCNACHIYVCDGTVDVPISFDLSIERIVSFLFAFLCKTHGMFEAVLLCLLTLEFSLMSFDLSFRLRAHENLVKLKPISLRKYDSAHSMYGVIGRGVHGAFDACARKHFVKRQTIRCHFWYVAHILERVFVVHLLQAA